jgi:signal transduction histidine kinase
MVLQSVFDVLPAHIAVLDERGVIVLINRAWAQFAESNRYSGADFVGLNYLDLCARTEGVDVADACLAFVEIRSVLSGEQDAFEMVYPCHGPERRRWFKLFVRRHGSGALLMHADVTAEYAKPAETLPAMLRDMAHEMRTPLNVILGFSDLITREIRGPVGEPYREYGELIQQSGRHLLDLIETILDISRIEAGALILDEATVEPNGLFRGVIDMMAPLARAKEIVIEAAFGHLPPVKADEMRLRQVLLNLVGNAIKFTPSGGRVTLGGRITASRAIEISVSDTGIGIAPYRHGAAPVRARPAGQQAENRRHRPWLAARPAADRIARRHPVAGQQAGRRHHGDDPTAGVANRAAPDRAGPPRHDSGLCLNRSARPASTEQVHARRSAFRLRRRQR